MSMSVMFLFPFPKFSGRLRKVYRGFFCKILIQSTTVPACGTSFTALVRGADMESQSYHSTLLKRRVTPFDRRVVYCPSVTISRLMRA